MMVIALDVTGLIAAQVSCDVRVQVITSPFKGKQAYVVLFVPTLILFFFHWYTGEGPPKLEVAVKVTGVVWQIGLSEATIEIVTGNEDPMIMLIWLEEAGFPLTQLPFEVSWHDTRSPFTGA